MRSCAKMSLPGQWMDLQMSPIISTSSHELSSSCTWSWRDSCRKPGRKHTPGYSRFRHVSQLSSQFQIIIAKNCYSLKLDWVCFILIAAISGIQTKLVLLIIWRVGVNCSTVGDINTPRVKCLCTFSPTHENKNMHALVFWQGIAT